MGPERDKGGYNYEFSANLYSVDGGYVQLGMVFWGGNNETLYVQINGTGCTHVFGGTSPTEIYNWLSHLDAVSLKRIDLAVDDHDGVFTVSSALRDHRAEAFYGGMGPKPGLGISHKYEGDGSLKQEMITVGSRFSRVYWRIYNKALEQQVEDTWHRSEAELKDFPIEVLLDIESAFTGLCDYAKQLNPAKPKKFHRANIVRHAINSFESDVRWLRKQVSRTVARLVNQLGHDYSAVISTIVRKEHMDDVMLRFNTSDIYQNIVAQKFYERECPF
jgi:phage replication initiation protein